MNVYLDILVRAATTYLVRALPLTLFKKPIRSRFVCSFLHYIPVACLTAMTFPAILSATAVLWSALAALAVAVVLSLLRCKLPVVALAACVTVFLVECLPF